MRSMETIKALNRIADALERQNGLLDDISVEIHEMRVLMGDVTCYPSDIKQPPRVLMGVVGAVETIKL